MRVSGSEENLSFDPDVRCFYVWFSRGGVDVFWFGGSTDIYYSGGGGEEGEEEEAISAV